MDDWQEAVFSSRHVHNRKRRGGGNNRSGGDAAFDVRKTLGTYELKGRAGTGQLHIYRLTDDQLGLVGQVRLAGTLHAPCILAGSRKALEAIDANLGHRHCGTQASQFASEEEEEEDDDDDDEGEDEDEDDDRIQRDDNIQSTEGKELSSQEAESETDILASSDSDEEKAAPRSTKRSAAAAVVTREIECENSRPSFEKNSFRSPKWWLRWRGAFSPPAPTTTSGPGPPPPPASCSTTMTHNSAGTGYIVFSGNKCSKFRGTISSDDGTWDNVAVTGWKSKGSAPSDTPIEWPVVSYPSTSSPHD